MKLIFCMQLNIKLTYEFVLSIFVGIYSHAQISKYNQLGKSLYLMIGQMC